MDKKISSYQYCNSLFNYSRFKTREVLVGDFPLGGNNPIRIQSMTTTDTMNTLATVEQSIRIIEAGADYVRITAPSIKEAQNLSEIKKELRQRGYKTPLIADIHFTPNAAELAARIVEKVRVNPGNYADKKKFQTIEYTHAEYDSELERIREKFLPLVKICKEYGTAMRIGTNHGSLSDRIMSRYGDTPHGMVESAFEFLRICEEERFFNIVLSMKSSNPQVMIQAYRLLVHKMVATERNYPLHLGVTEAGDGEDGRIKSSVGIGTLLEDGLGDTIRVSLTEDPEFEVPVAFELAKRYERKINELRNVQFNSNIINDQLLPTIHSPFEYKKRETISISNVGGDNVPRVIIDLSDDLPNFASLQKIGYHYSEQLDKWNIGDMACDFIYLGKQDVNFEIPGTLKKIVDYSKWQKSEIKRKTAEEFPMMTSYEYLISNDKSPVLNFIQVDLNSFTSDFLEKIKKDTSIVLILTTENIHGMAEQRKIFFQLLSKEIKCPVIIKRSYNDVSELQTQLYSSTDFGGLLIDGFGDGLWLQGINNQSPNSDFINRTCFGILQATRTRISKTEYISCPSCGRTLFDLQEVTAKIRSRTHHLKGVKIAIMGCIVNGPGEMADADFGYVGSGLGKITLYKGKEVVRRSIGSSVAVDELINLIKENGAWVEPK